MSFIDYLRAKRTVDDRALNPRVLERLRIEVGPRLSVLEVGAGIGTMVDRLHGWGLLNDADYTAIDLQAANVAEARRRFSEEWPRRGFEVQAQDDRLRLQCDGTRLDLGFETVNLRDFLRRENHRRWDLIVAHAFLDLVDLPTVLPPLVGLARPGGLLYFTLNFDGSTIFRPILDLDAQIERLYHRTMDDRMIDGLPSGDSRCGRHLVEQLPTHGVEILASGPSDWRVEPIAGAYPEQEAAFLHYIIETISEALNGHPDLDATAFSRWVEARHRQIEDGVLSYMASHQDILGRAEGPDRQ